MSFVSHSSAVRSRKIFIPVLMIALIAVLAFASSASAAKGYRMNVIAQYGVKGLTATQAGSRSFLYSKKGFNPSHKVAKIVRRKNGVKVRLHKRERVVYAYYLYIAAGSEEVHLKRWSGHGVLPLVQPVNIDGKKTRIKATEVFAWVLLKHHEVTRQTPLSE